jgi:hypothetical protein
VKFDHRELMPDGEREDGAEVRTEALHRANDSSLERAGLLISRLLLDLLLIDAAVETWLAGSPFRWAIVGAAALYFALSIWAVVQGSKLAAPGLVTQTPAAFYILLGFLAGTTSWPEGFERGARLLRQPTAVVLAGATLAVVCLAVYRLAMPKGTWFWIRIAVLTLGLYASAAIVLGILGRTPYATMMQGQSEWKALPYWLRGACIGGLVLVPLGFVRELFTSMARVALTGHLRWMLVFGLGTWLAYNGISFQP